MIGWVQNLLAAQVIGQVITQVICQVMAGYTDYQGVRGYLIT